MHTQHNHGSKNWSPANTIHRCCTTFERKNKIRSNNWDAFFYQRIVLHMWTVKENKRHKRKRKRNKKTYCYAYSKNTQPTVTIAWDFHDLRSFPLKSPSLLLNCETFITSVEQKSTIRAIRCSPSSDGGRVVVLLLLRHMLRVVFGTIRCLLIKGKSCGIGETIFADHTLEAHVVKPHAAHSGFCCISLVTRLVALRTFRSRGSEFLCHVVLFACNRRLV